MYKLSTSVYSYIGDTTDTLNRLTKATPTTMALSDLSTNNYSAPNKSSPNSDNQLIFMNQPMMWWVESLNTPASVAYAPVSNYVNWAYTANSKIYHIGTPISDYLIPNSIASSIVNHEAKVMTNTYVMKFGMVKVDTFTL